MSHQYDEDDPIRSKTTQKYREMYDTIDWGDSPGSSQGAEARTPYSCAKCCDTGCIVDPDADESTFVTEADGLIDCPECVGTREP